MICFQKKKLYCGLVWILKEESAAAPPTGGRQTHSMV